jgi:hypothetical protein
VWGLSPTSSSPLPPCPPGSSPTWWRPSCATNTPLTMGLVSGALCGGFVGCCAGWWWVGGGGGRLHPEWHRTHKHTSAQRVVSPPPAHHHHVAHPLSSVACLKFQTEYSCTVLLLYSCTAVPLYYLYAFLVTRGHCLFITSIQ